jgi:hypothetical protein
MTFPLREREPDNEDWHCFCWVCGKDLRNEWFIAKVFKEGDGEIDDNDGPLFFCDKCARKNGYRP